MKHEEEDPLSPLLREWRAPDPPAGIDTRMLAAFRQRAAGRQNWWAMIWSTRVSIPVPVLAALLLLVCAAAVWLRRPVEPPPVAGGYITRLEVVGFQPLRDGPARVIRRKEEN